MGKIASVLIAFGFVAASFGGVAHLAAEQATSVAQRTVLVGGLPTSTINSVRDVAAVAARRTASPLPQVVGTISGRVRDSRSGQALAAVQVFIADLDMGVLSQQN